MVTVPSWVAIIKGAAFWTAQPTEFSPLSFENLNKNFRNLTKKFTWTVFLRDKKYILGKKGSNYMLDNNDNLCRSISIYFSRG